MYWNICKIYFKTQRNTQTKIMQKKKKRENKDLKDTSKTVNTWIIGVPFFLEKKERRDRIEQITENFFLNLKKNLSELT